MAETPGSLVFLQLEKARPAVGLVVFGLTLSFFVDVSANASWFEVARFGSAHAARALMTMPARSASQRDQAREQASDQAREPAPKAVPEAYIKLANGKAAQGAKVVAKTQFRSSNADPREIEVTTFADDFGRFEIRGPEGAYSIEISLGKLSGTYAAQLKDGKLEPALFLLR